MPSPIDLKRLLFVRGDITDLSLFLLGMAAVAGMLRTKRTHRVMVEDIDGAVREWCATEDLMHAEEECFDLRREGRSAWVESK